MRAIIVRKKFWGLQMLTWVWLARAKHELTKPKSTFRPQNFLSGLRASHEQSIPFTNWGSCLAWAVVAQGQLSPWGSCLPGQLSPRQLLPGQLLPGQLLAHPITGGMEDI